MAGSFYSVPHYLVGQEVRVHWDDRMVRVYATGQAVAVHGLAGTGRFVTRQEHRPVHKPARQEAYAGPLLTKAEHIGARALDWAQAAIGERGVRAYRLLQGMLSLTRNHPKERVDWACQVALKRRQFRYKYCVVYWNRQQPRVRSKYPRSSRITKSSGTYSNMLRRYHYDTRTERKFRSLRLSGMVAMLDTKPGGHSPLTCVYRVSRIAGPGRTESSPRPPVGQTSETGWIVQTKTLASFDWSFNPTIPKALVLDLATARFVPEHGGVLLIGQPGTGKSHIALALTLSAIEAGYTARYRSAFDLAQDLAEAQATGTRKDVVQQLTKVDLLVIEDLGMRRLPPTAAEDLLEVFARRYETAATVLTTNRPVEDWGQILGDNAAAGAILDRFLHHAEIIRLQGKSYRMHDRQQRRLNQHPSDLAQEEK